MRVSIGALTVDMTRAEAARFRYPLLLLHGLWTGAWLWEGAAGYLAHRGWESWAPELVGSATPEVVLAALTDVVRALPAPPIVVTHGTGAGLGALVAGRAGSPALVAMAPLVSPADAPTAGVFGVLARWRSRAALAAPPRAIRGVLTEAGRPDAPRDSGAIWHALATGRLRLPRDLACPAVALWHVGDRLATAATAAALSADFRWEEHPLPGGHLALAGPGFERVADAVHRWIVRSLGADLLAFLDDEEL
jgi:hypothetical protein